MDTNLVKNKLKGCYVTIPTPFEDKDSFPVNNSALREYTRFLLDNGLDKNYATYLAGGAAGDFSTMTLNERLSVGEIVADEVNGMVPIALGGQTTSTNELVQLAKAAQSMNFDFLQISCPFYFTHTEDDFLEFVKEGAKAAPNVGIIVYNTFWTSTNVSDQLVEKFADISNIVGLKWATPRTDAMEFEDITSSYSERFTIIDNNLFFPYSSMPSLNAQAFEVHLCNYWPEWGIKLINEIQNKNYEEVARMMIKEAMPFYKLWVEIEQDYTSGDGYLDKFCMELIGLPSSRCRPPTRDIREIYKEKTYQMMKKSGVPKLLKLKEN
ncbi:dihydrodipicolinate synthase family protein [Alphaproteobacteria bacterium]|nr:dihydrodipicolinate synthase family protein [Alphaproteobacteria bacterium]